MRIEVDTDLTLVADRVGVPGDRPPVVLLHGGGQTRHSWRGTAEALAARGHQVWNVDLRGHGESDWAPDRDYGTEALARDLSVIVDDVIGRAPVVVGASLGGLTGLVAEATYPGLLRALVLVDISTRVEREGIARILEFMTSSPDGFASLDQAAAAVARYRRVPVGSVRPGGLARNLRQGDDGRWRWHWDPELLADADGRSERYEALYGAAASALRVPTLLVRGRQSDVVSHEGVALFLSQCPHAELLDIEGASHMVVGDRNDVFTAAVAAFLDRLPAGARARSA